MKNLLQFICIGIFVLETYSCKEDRFVSSSMLTPEENRAVKSKITRSIPTGMNGRSVQIDPAFIDNIGKVSPEQLVEDLKRTGVNSVHYTVAEYWDGTQNDKLLRPNYLQAIKNSGIKIWLMLLGNCIYGNAIPGGDGWKMELLDPSSIDNTTHLYSFHNKDYVDWQAERIKNILNKANKYSNIFDGIEFAESYFPEWETIDAQSPKKRFYGDVSKSTIDQFADKYFIPKQNLTFETIKKNTIYYKQWVEFRSDAVINFNQQMKKAINEANPNIYFAAWGIGIKGGNLAGIKEYFGLDMRRIISTVNPDVFFIQTSSQDWSKDNLPSNYAIDYKYILDSIKLGNPTIPIGIQGDVVSSYHDKVTGNLDGSAVARPANWWLGFMDYTLSNGYATATFYEYNLTKKYGFWLPSNNINLNYKIRAFKDTIISSDYINFDPQTFNIVDRKPGYWYKIQTASQYKWIKLE
ncbi:hypothetical protein [Chryseobacterium sp.]|uniref:hypothetical protein n=1 Tax=Chryseobacterium sp. TaxID=1871047 RepID=UPI0025C49072|nr:hypothetical protein [Chryseobacterium sp.]MBV8326840.1 hypothetical protein [Chryseobacterium sp.]